MNEAGTINSINTVYGPYEDKRAVVKDPSWEEMDREEILNLRVNFWNSRRRDKEHQWYKTIGLLLYYYWVMTNSFFEHRHIHKSIEK